MCPLEGQKIRGGMTSRIEKQISRRGNTSLETKTRGAMGELEASLFFLSSGYEVFKNITEIGPDLIIMKGNKKRIVEVRTQLSSERLKAPRNRCDLIFYILTGHYKIVVVGSNKRFTFDRIKIK